MGNLLITLIGALLSAACGGYVGHKFTVKLFHERGTLQMKAFLSEFELLNERYRSCVISLIEDFKNPLKDRYLGISKFDMSIVDGLSIELCASQHPLNKEQRKLITGVRSILAKIKDDESKRDDVIELWFNKEDERQARQSIRHYTAHLLVDVVQIVFYTQKLVEEKQNFTFGNYGTQEQAVAVCSICDIEYEHDFWEKIESMYAPSE